jgi:lipopolysaccharide heptosyltransferase II
MKYIGDVVLTTPVIHSLRHAVPDAFIAYMGDAGAVSLLEQNPYLDEIIPFDFSAPTVREQPRVAWLLRRRKFDMVIDLFGNPRSALLTRLSGAAVRVGLDRPGRGRFYTVRVQDAPRRKTAVEFHEQFLQAVGIEPVYHTPEIFLSEQERSAGKASLGGVKRIVALQPGATWPAKKWTPEGFAGVAGRLQKEQRVEVVLTGGPKDADVLRQVAAMAGGSLRTFIGLPLRELAALYAASAVVVSNDAGPMHIAAAVGTPTIGIFGPGEEDIWFPYDPALGHIALRKEVPCHPCRLDVCTREGAGFMECMRSLTVDEVTDAVGAVLNRSLR